MSTKIGLDELHFAAITEDENGYESYEHHCDRSDKREGFVTYVIGGIMYG